jgi:NAD(P)H-nitrite reductase large subunit
MTEEDAIIVCRCEDVTLGEITDAIAKGYATVDEIKHYLRAGMGPCQGRTCGHLMAQIIARETGRPIAEVWPMRARPPYHLVPFATILSESDEAVMFPNEGGR